MQLSIGFSIFNSRTHLHPVFLAYSHSASLTQYLKKTLAMGDSSHVLLLTSRRLSKPRTNKSSSNLPSEQPTTPSSPHNSSDLDYFGSDAVVIDSRGERRSRSKSRSRIKAYLYGSSHDLVQNSSDEDETQPTVTGAARDVRKRLSRTGSSIMSLQSAKVSVMRLSNSSSSILLSPRSTESQGMDPEESAMIADQIKQRAYHDSLAAQNHVSTPVDMDKHIDSTMAPLRRKSLYTPGIATRNASDILRKPPKPLTDHEYYYDPSRPETSPLSHLASLRVGEDGRSTPCDLQYPQLGGLQLGTLRVTNGASSTPVPVNQTLDLAYRPATPESKTNDEYYTASEGSVSGDRDHAVPLPPRADSPLKLETKIESDMRADYRITSSPDKPLLFERESSSECFLFSSERSDQTACFEGRASGQGARLRTKLFSDALDSEKRMLNKPFSNRQISQICATEAPESTKFLTLGKRSTDDPEQFEREMPKESFHPEVGSPKSCHVDEGTLDQRFLLSSKIPREVVRFEGETLSESFPSKTRSFGYDSVQDGMPHERCHLGAQSPSGALDIADDYIAELESSPFAYSSPEDKRTAIPQSRDVTNEMWRSCTVEADMQHASHGSGSREDAFRKLTVNGDMPSPWKPERLSVPPSQPTRHSASAELPQTDSRDWSHTSLTGGPTNEVCFETKNHPNRPTQVTASLQPQPLESARSSFRSPISKLKKQRPKSQPPPVNLISEHHELTDANIPRIPSIIAARHADRLSQFPLLDHTFASSQHTIANEALYPARVHDTPVLFPSPANTLQAASAPLRSFRKATPKPRASTIAVDEDDWSASSLVRSPSWSEFGSGSRRKQQRKLAKEEKEIEKRLLKEEKELEKQRQKSRKDLDRHIRKDENKPKINPSRSASRTRARSSEGQRPHDTLMTIADFGTVTESLGNSPYDIAKSTPPNPQTARRWHPHQMSTATPRPNPSLGAGARAQTIFLDTPSVPALAAVDLKVHNIEWARERQRSQTSSTPSAESLIKPGAIPAKFARHESVTMEITPPVPALPSATQVKRREAEIMRSRPRSMFLEAPMPIATSQHIEDETAVPRSPESALSATPRKTKSSEIVPDIWSSGSLERKSAKTVDDSKRGSNNFIGQNHKAMSTKDQHWEIQSNAWSQRRKSAGEALLSNRVKEGFDNQEVANSTALRGHNEGPTPRTGAFDPEVYQTFMPIPSHLGPFPNPLASHPRLTTQQPTSASNTTVPHNQFNTHQTKRYGLTSRASTSSPCVSSVPLIQQGSQPASTPSRARTQSFQIQRKRVGSGPSVIRAGTAIGSSQYASVLA